MTLDTKEVEKRFKKNGLILLSRYKTQRDKVKAKCKCGNIFCVIPYGVFRNGSNICKKCKLRKSKYIDKKIGFITIRSYDGKYFQCFCDCGNKCEKRDTAVSAAFSSKSDIFSCGCAMYQYAKGNANYLWTGCGDISGKYWSSCKSGAKIRNIDFSVNISDAWFVFLKQNKKCAVTGCELTFSSSMEYNKFAASMDRIDSSLPYIADNIQWVHKTINNMKWDLSQTDLFLYCNLIIHPLINRTGDIHVIPRSGTWDGCGNIGKDYYSRIKRSAKKRNIFFNINKIFLWKLFIKQNGCCALTGLPLRFGRPHSKEITASLDRINNNKGYIKNNIQWVHKIINQKIRKNMSLDELRYWSKLIVSG